MVGISGELSPPINFLITVLPRSPAEGGDLTRSLLRSLPWRCVIYTVRALAPAPHHGDAGRASARSHACGRNISLMTL